MAQMLQALLTNREQREERREEHHHHDEEMTRSEREIEIANVVAEDSLKESTERAKQL